MESFEYWSSKIRTRVVYYSSSNRVLEYSSTRILEYSSTCCSPTDEQSFLGQVKINTYSTINLLCCIYLFSF